MSMIDSVVMYKKKKNKKQSINQLNQNLKP